MGTGVVQEMWDVEDILSRLTLAEKTALLSGVDAWHTAPVPRLKIPSIRLTDGPAAGSDE